MDKLESQKKFYDEKFHKLNSDPINNLKQFSKYKFVKKLLKNTKGKILVIGCGSKNDMGIINKNCNGIGIDISKTAIERSKKMYPQFDYYVMNALDLKFEDNSFDAIVCSEVIEHVEDEKKLLEEIKRVLKAEGTFVITTPNWWSFYGLARKTAERLFKRPFTADNQPIDNWTTPTLLRKKLLPYFKLKGFYGLWYYPPTGKGKIKILGNILLPLFWLFYPLELLLRGCLPWFGHIIIFKVKKSR